MTPFVCWPDPRWLLLMCRLFPSGLRQEGDQSLGCAERYLTARGDVQGGAAHPVHTLASRRPYPHHESLHRAPPYAARFRLP